MNQVRHILDACLIVMMIFMGYFLYTSFSESGIIGSNKKAEQVSTVAKVAGPGAKLFQQQCAGCHHMQRQLLAPALNGVSERGPWTDRMNLVKWLRSPAGFIPTTPYTRKLNEEYPVNMPSFAHLTEEEINLIIDHISGREN